jgi:hypothetical protein
MIYEDVFQEPSLGAKRRRCVPKCLWEGLKNAHHRPNSSLKSQ